MLYSLFLEIWSIDGAGRPFGASSIALMWLVTWVLRAFLCRDSKPVFC